MTTFIELYICTACYIEEMHGNNIICEKNIEDNYEECTTGLA